MQGLFGVRKSSERYSIHRLNLDCSLMCSAGNCQESGTCSICMDTKTQHSEKDLECMVAYIIIYELYADS